MGRKSAKLEFELMVEFVPVPMEGAGLLLLLQVLKSEEPINVAEAADERMGIDHDNDDHFSIAVDGHALVADRVLQGQDA